MTKKDYAASLKYYKVEYVPISERLYYEYADELLKHIRELVELENGINFTGNAEIAIVLTEEELAEFVESIWANCFAKCRKLYMGHDLLPDRSEQEDGTFENPRYCRSALFPITITVICRRVHYDRIL